MKRESYTVSLTTEFRKRGDKMSDDTKRTQEVDGKYFNQNIVVFGTKQP